DAREARARGGDELNLAVLRRGAHGQFPAGCARENRKFERGAHLAMQGMVCGGNFPGSGIGIVMGSDIRQQRRFGAPSARMMVGDESCSFTRPRGFFDGCLPGRPFANLENSSSIILAAPGGALTARRARKSSSFEGPPADWKLRIQLRRRSRTS